MQQISNSIDIRTTPQQAIGAFTDPDMLRAWWKVERCLVETRPGGLYTLAWGITEQGIRYVSTGIVLDYQPDARLLVGHYLYLNPERPFLGGQELEVNALDMGESTKLSVRQGPYPLNAGDDWEWYYGAVVEAWPAVLQTIKSYLEGSE